MKTTRRIRGPDILRDLGAAALAASLAPFAVQPGGLYAAFRAGDQHSTPPHLGTHILIEKLRHLPASPYQGMHTGKILSTCTSLCACLTMRT